jgi:hypothetical protein
MFLNEYVHDRAHRALTVNVSESGLYVNKVIAPLNRGTRVVGLEFELPGTGETIWARGEICYEDVPLHVGGPRAGFAGRGGGDGQEPPFQIDEYFHGQGIRFAAMPRMHARLLRDYCIEKRRTQLSDLLGKIRRSAYH